MSSSKKKRRRSIFEAANAVFRGTTIRTYDRFAIKAKISEHPAIFDSVVRMYGVDTVVQIICSLLDNGKIALESYAHLELAKTRQLSTVRKRQHDALEQEAAESEAKALDEATRSDLAMHEGDQDGEQIDVAEAGPIEDSSGSNSSKSPSLFPPYLSYTSQHKLLNTVQRVLEDCCYDWVAKWIPSLLDERKWTCSEAVELSKWTATIPKRFANLSSEATSLESEETLAAVFLATHPLRHAAVHRVHTSVKGVDSMLNNALNLATVLQDTQRKCRLHNLLMDFRATMQAMEQNKIGLENQLDEELSNIQEQRVALDKKEKEARLGMFQHDQENTAQMSCLFENSIRNLTSMDQPSATGKHNNARNPNPEEARGGAIASGIPDKDGADDSQTATAEAGSEDTDSKPSNHGDGEASTSESPGFSVQQIENDGGALLSELDLGDLNPPPQFTGKKLARDLKSAWGSGR